MCPQRWQMEVVRWHMVDIGLDVYWLIDLGGG